MSRLQCRWSIKLEGRGSANINGWCYKIDKNTRIGRLLGERNLVFYSPKENTLLLEDSMEENLMMKRQLERGMTIMTINNPNCLLYDRCSEFVDHLFFYYEYSNWVLKQVLHNASDFLNIKSNFNDNTIELEKLPNGSKVWGFDQTILASVSWAL